MVVRRKSGLPKQYFYNAAAIGAVVLTGALAVRSGLDFETAPSCAVTSFVAAPLPFGFDNGSVDLVDVRARSAGDDWGMDTNLVLTATGNTSGDVTMRVALPGRGAKGGGHASPSARRDMDVVDRTSGMGFNWDAGLLRGADGRSGCLSYAVQVPEEFPARGGGVLPGFVLRTSDGARILAMPVRWHDGGEVGVRVSGDDGKSAHEFRAESGAAKLQPGRWVTVSQQVVINQVGQSDGAIRVWVNGEMAIERDGLQFFGPDVRTDFDRVAAHVHFTDRDGIWLQAPSDTEVSLKGLTLHRPN